MKSSAGCGGATGVDLGMAMATDDADPNPSIANDAPDKWKDGPAQVKAVGAGVYLLFDWDNGNRKGMIDARRESGRPRRCARAPGTVPCGRARQGRGVCRRSRRHRRPGCRAHRRRGAAEPPPTSVPRRWAPWTVIDGNDRKSSRIAALTSIVEQLERMVPMEMPDPDPEVVALAREAFGYKPAK